MFLYDMFLTWLICFTSPIRLDSVDVLCCAIGFSLSADRLYCIALISKRNFEAYLFLTKEVPAYFALVLFAVEVYYKL